MHFINQVIQNFTKNPTRYSCTARFSDPCILVQEEQLFRFCDFWYGCRSGTSDPYLRLMDSAPDPDPAPDPALFISDHQDSNKKYFCLFIFKVHLHPSQKIKSHKEVRKQQKSRFFFIYLLLDGRIRETQKIGTDGEHLEEKSYSNPISMPRYQYQSFQKKAFEPLGHILRSCYTINWRNEKVYDAQKTFTMASLRRSNCGVSMMAWHTGGTTKKLR